MKTTGTREVLSERPGGYGASIARGGLIEEVLRGKGKFHFSCVGPAPRALQSYLKLRDLERSLWRAGRWQEMLRVRERMEKMVEFKWEDDVFNTIMTAGKNDLLDKYLAGSSYTATFYLGLVSSVSYSAIAAGDTAAQINGTNGWKEAGNANQPTYSQGTRPAPSWSGAASGSKATSANVVFSMTGTGTAKGSFLITNSTKDGTTGILFSGGLFTQGDRNVVSGDTINGTYTLSV